MNEIGMNGNGRVNGRLPRYHQIAGALRTRIREGALRPGARLDNQRRLAKSFGVTLMTLRQALELLEREHLIARRHGLGTFVAAPSIDYDILQLRRFAGDLSAKGEHVSAVRLGRREAGELGCPAGAPAFESERVSYDAAGAPVVFDRVFIPGDRFRITRDLRYEGAAS